MAEVPGLKATNVVLVHGGFVDGLKGRLEKRFG